jgi:hypothetical protein
LRTNEGDTRELNARGPRGHPAATHDLSKPQKFGHHSHALVLKLVTMHDVTPPLRILAI